MEAEPHNSSKSVVEVREPGVQGHFQLHRESESSLGYKGTFLKTNKQNKRCPLLYNKGHIFHFFLLTCDIDYFASF